MKKTIVSTNRLMILAVMMVMTISARSAMPLGSSKNAMSYNAAKNEALFLLQIRSQLQFNGHPSLIIAQVPDTFLRPFGSKRQSRAHPVRH